MYRVAQLSFLRFFRPHRWWEVSKIFERKIGYEIIFYAWTCNWVLSNFKRLETSFPPARSISARLFICVPKSGWGIGKAHKGGQKKILFRGIRIDARMPMYSAPSQPNKSWPGSKVRLFGRVHLPSLSGYEMSVLIPPHCPSGAEAQLFLLGISARENFKKPVFR